MAILLSLWNLKSAQVNTAHRPSKVENGKARVDLDPYHAWSNRRFWGYVGKVETSLSENTDAPFDVTVVGRVWFVEDY